MNDAPVKVTEKARIAKEIQDDKWMQQLADLAAENGWDEHDCCVPMLIFKHQFIAALCKAKWGDYYNYHGCSQDGAIVEKKYTPKLCPGCLPANEYVITQIALKPESERIAYLKEVFL